MRFKWDSNGMLPVPGFNEAVCSNHGPWSLEKHNCCWNLDSKHSSKLEECQKKSHPCFKRHRSLSWTWCPGKSLASSFPSSWVIYRMMTHSDSAKKHTHAYEDDEPPFGISPKNTLDRKNFKCLRAHDSFNFNFNFNYITAADCAVPRDDTVCLPNTRDWHEHQLL